MRQDCQKFQNQVLDSMDIVQKIKQSQDQIQNDYNKKLTTSFRELERVQT